MANLCIGFDFVLLKTVTRWCLGEEGQWASLIRRRNEWLRQHARRDLKEGRRGISKESERENPRANFTIPKYEFGAYLASRGLRELQG
jgi:hypothetical protein